MTEQRSDRLEFQKFVVFLAIAPHHRDSTDLNFITHTGYNHILKPDGARFLNLTQHVFAGRILKNKCSIESVASENWQSALLLKSFSLDFSFNRRCRDRRAKAATWAV